MRHLEMFHGPPISPARARVVGVSDLLSRLQGLRAQVPAQAPSQAQGASTASTPAPSTASPPRRRGRPPKAQAPEAPTSPPPGPLEPEAALRTADRRMAALRAIREGLSLEEAAKGYRLKKESLRALVIATVGDLEKPAHQEAVEIRRAILARKEELLRAVWGAATAKNHIVSFDREGTPNIGDGPSVPHARLALDLIKEVERTFGLEAPTLSRIEISGEVSIGSQYSPEELAEAERRLTAVVEGQALAEEDLAEVVSLDERRP